LLLTFQLHPVGAVTVTLPDPPVAVKDLDKGDMVEVQAAPSWVTVKVLSAMVRIPVRGAVLPLAVTE
jgi:hypothetical protein